MLERWTIDSVADEIVSQFKGADPTPKLLRRFYNEGKRHGRKGLSPEPMRDFLVNAVELAASKITQEFLEAEQQVDASRAAMEARQTMLSEDLSTSARATAPEVDAGSSGSGLGTKVAGPDLGGSLERLKAKRAAADAERRRQAQEQSERELQGMKAEALITKQKLDDLPDHYRQMVESCHETGELMWTRYVQGYSYGESKRGAPDTDDGGPGPEIEFEYPAALAPTEAAHEQADPGEEMTDGAS